MALVFLDTNVILRHLLQDHPDQSPKATAFLSRVENNEIQVRISELVIFEIIFTLQRQYKKSKQMIRENFLPLLMMPGILIARKRRWRKIFNLYVDLNIPFADAYHAVLMEGLKLKEIVSFDRDFDRIPGIIRAEP
ncbi:MAG TPA: PIN domain-containing protein [Thermodesulfobacteriota bacterium]|nr:PIN domain-containing protein [Thermodesulfobacteriota bacterium]